MFVPSDFVTIGLLIALEGLLSADNAMVLAILVLGLPKAQQKKALRYGMIGAFAFRAIATLLAAYMIQLGWVKLVGAGYLLYLVYRHFGGGSSGEDRRTPPKAQPWLGLSPFWATVVEGRAHGHRLRDRLDPRRGGDVAEAVGDSDRRHSRHRDDAAGDRQAAGAGRALSGAGGRRLRDHPLGRPQAAD